MNVAVDDLCLFACARKSIARLKPVTHIVIRTAIIFAIIAVFFVLPSGVFAQSNYIENTAVQFDSGTYNSTYRIITGSIASVVLDNYGRSAGIGTPDAAKWFNSSWHYRIPLTINSADTASISSYQIPLTINTQSLIASGRLNSSASDLRFTTATINDLPQSLPYCIDSGLNTAATKVWVKVPVVLPGADTKLYMYYGNSSAAAASTTSTFIFGDDFCGANGIDISSTSWTKVQSAAPLTGSLIDIQNNSMRMLFGSASGTKYYGVRSAASYSFASLRRYHFRVRANNFGSGSASQITLCPYITQSTELEDSWFRFSVVHDATPYIILEENNLGNRITLVNNTNTVVGDHDVDLILSSSKVIVLFDGTEIYNADNDLAFTIPYVYIESKSAYPILNDFYFDNAFISQGAIPAPLLGSIGAEQGMYFSSGSFVSQAIDSGASNSKYTMFDWNQALSSYSAVAVYARSHNTDVSISSYSLLTKATDPGLSGRYIQYRLNLSNTDTRYTAYVSTIAINIVAFPVCPINLGGVAQSSMTLTWSWEDNSSDMNQEDGFIVYDQYFNQKASLPANTTSFTESGLQANTQYTRSIRSYNTAGSSDSVSISAYTLPKPPEIYCANSTGTWFSQQLNFENLAGFGANGVAYYRYVCDSNALYNAWKDTETVWNAGTLTTTPLQTGVYFLHIKSYNNDNFSGGSKTYGPYLCDNEAPAINGFNPASQPWTNEQINVQYTISDAYNASKLAFYQYQWTFSTDMPVAGWSASDSIVAGTTYYILTSSTLAEDSKYLHIQAVDTAGNTGYAYSGPYQTDTASPTASVSINNGDLYTFQSSVTLSLSQTDSLSGVKEVRYRNNTGSWSSWESASSSKNWSLSLGTGTKSVEYEVIDFAGNSQTASDSIVVDSRTIISGSSPGGIVSGASEAENNIFPVNALLSWAPTGTPIAGKTISFHFSGSTLTAQTDNEGYATVNFTAPVSSGTSNFSVSFDSDPVFGASSANGPATFARRGVYMYSQDVVTTVNSSFFTTTTLEDWATRSKIEGRTIRFTFDGIEKTAQTNSVGVASVTYVAQSSTNVFTFSSIFDGDATYSSSTVSGNVGVGMRLTSIVPSDVSTFANTVFTAQARLKDDAANDIVGSTITFTFNGEVKTAITNSVGIASVTYSASAASGTFVYNARFDGDLLYYQSSDSATVSIVVRPTTLVTNNPAGYTIDSFNTWGKIVDSVSGTGVSGKTLTYIFEGITQTAVTDGAGVSSVTFNTGTLARVSTCYYYFSGDETYSASNSSSVVIITLRPVGMNVQNVSATVYSTFTAQITLNDVALSAGIADKTVTFYFSDSTKTVLTDAAGIATAAFLSPSSSGTYYYNAVFSGDVSYAGWIATGTVTVNSRSTTILPPPRWTYALDPISVLADLKDTATNSAIYPETISFIFDGLIRSTETNSQGRAFEVYSGTANSGAYTYSAVFQGNESYAASSATAVISIFRRPVSLSAYNVSTQANCEFYASAELKDGINSALLINKTIIYDFQGSTKSATTNELGIATATFTSPISTGSYSYNVTFVQDNTYDTMSSTAFVSVTCRPVDLYSYQKNVVANDQVYIQAGLFDHITSSALIGLPVRFILNSSTITANTNASGIATAGPFAGINSTGTYNFTAYYDGSSFYTATNSSSSVTVLPRPTTIEKYDMTVIANSTFSARADLKDTILNTGIQNKTMTFIFQGSTNTVVSGVFGISSTTYFAPSTAGTYAYSSDFNGDMTYDKSNNTGYITVGLRPVTITSPEMAVVANSTFTISASLRDTTLGTAITNSVLKFYFLSTTHTVTTDSLGVASTSFVAPASSASYTCLISFSGDSLYLANSASTLIHVGLRTPELISFDVSPIAQSTFTVTARLRDSVTAESLTGKIISFAFMSSSKTAAVNSVGIATVTFTAPATISTFTYSVAFAGDNLYSAAENQSSVFVQKRPVIINAQDISSVMAGSTFTATAEIRDAETNVLIATQPVSFVFLGITKTTETNFIGVATATYIVPAATGTLNYSVVYEGNDLYAPSEATANVIIVNRLTSIEPVAISAVISMPATLEARLKDFETGALLTGYAVSFVFQGSTVTSITNDIGIATATFTAPATTGTYVYNASFSGIGIYAASQSQAIVTVGIRPTILSASGASTLALDPFSVSATLRDTLTGDNIENQTITFTFQGSSITAVTNATGVAVATFTAVSSSGTYTYYAYFSGDTIYNANSAQATVTVNRRPLVFVPKDGIYYDWAWTLQNIDPGVTVKDGNTSVVISGLSISYCFFGSTYTAVTNSSGYSITSIPPLTFSGWYEILVSFAGNATYLPVSDLDSTGVYVDARWSSITPFSVDTSANTIFTAQAQLRDTISNPDTDITNKPVTLTFQGISKTSLTDGSGIAVSTFMAPSSVGVYELKASFIADGTYDASLSTNAVNVGLRSTTVTPLTEPVLVGSGKLFAISAKLVDIATGGGVPDKSLTFIFEGSTITAITDGITGIAQAQFTSPVAIASYTYTVSFSADNVYSACNTTGTVIVQKNATVLNGDNISVYAGNSFNAVATLTYAAGGEPIAGKTISFVFQGTSTISGSAVTNSIGVATFTYTAPLSTGTYNYTAAYEGDTQNSVSSDTVNNVTVLRRLTVVETDAVNTYIDDSFVAEATLKDTQLAAGLAEKPIIFIFHGIIDTSTATITSSSLVVGQATAAFSAPVSSGVFSCVAAFNGDALYDVHSDTKNVVVNRRLVNLVADNAATETNSEFSVTAALTDVTPTLPSAVELSSKTIRFVFQGVTKYAITDALGIAATTYFSPESAGAYNYTAAFDGDTTFANGNDNINTVTVTKRACTVSGDDISTSVGSEFFARAALTDNIDGSKITNRAVSFVFQESTKTAITNAVGVATVTFSSPLSVGIFNYTAAFAGDFTYNSSTDSINAVTVLSGSTTVVAGDITTNVNSVFFASATLSMSVSGSVIPGKTIRFLFDGSTSTALTDGNGLAVATFTALSGGLHRLDTIFDGDAVYLASYGTATVTVELRPTALVMPSGISIANEIYTATATLRDFLTAQTISEMPVRFVFQESTFTATTNVSGIAVSTFTAAASSGTFIIEAAYNGDSVYTSTAVFAWVNVSARPASIILENVSTLAMSVFTASATFKDSLNNQFISGQTINFVFQGSTFSALTNGFGLAVSTFTAPSVSGSFQLIANFPGNALYSGVYSSCTVTVEKRPTTVASSDALAMVNTVFASTATLTDALSLLPLQNKQVKFVFNNSTFTATTNSSGVAVSTFTAFVSSGSYNISIYFNGDSSYMASSTAAIVTVERANLLLHMPDIATINSEVFTATAVVRDALSLGLLAGKHVRFIFQESSYTATTNSFGIAVASITAPPLTGAYQINLAFDSDASYFSSSSSATVSVATRPVRFVTQDVSVYSQNVFSSTVTLRDATNSLPISGRAVRFIFQGSTFTATTGGSGIAVSTFTAPSSSGTYRMDLAFDGDSTYSLLTATSTISVLARFTTIIPQNVTTNVLDVFSATVTIRDSLTSLPLEGKVVRFMFGNSTFSATSLTDGVAVSTFTAPVSSGTYLISCNFAGDSVYAASTASITITAVVRASKVANMNISAKVMDVFVATATLSDFATTLPIAGKPVRFIFQGSTYTATTNSVGTATATITAPLSAGAYRIDAAFGGDSTYASDTASATVSVSLRPSSISGQDAAGIINEIFFATATLKDAVSSLGISGKQVKFIFNNSTFTATTNSSGVAVSTFTAPSSAAAYRIDFAFNADLAYAESASSATVTIGRRSMTLSLSTGPAVIDEIFFTSVTVRDSISLGPISNRVVVFLFQNSTFTAVTNTNGVAVSTYTAPPTSGSYRIDVSFGGDSAYLSAATSSTISVSRRPMSIIADNASANSLDVFTATATVRDGINLQLLQNKQVKFIFQGSTFTALSDASGIAVSTFTAPSVSGVYRIDSSFSGDATYLATASSASITVSKRNLAIHIDSVTVSALDVFTASATLSDTQTLQPVSGKIVRYVFQGSTQTAVSNINGLAAVTFTAPISSGNFQISGYFDGDTSYFPSSTSSVVAVQRRLSSISSYDADTIVSALFIASATLTDASTSVGISNKQVRFVFLGSTYTATTNASGVASSVISAPASSGTYNALVTFVGDSTYMLSETSAAVAVHRRSAVLPVANVTALLNDIFIASATMRDSISMAPLPDKTICFVFQGSTMTALSDSEGVAQSTFTVPSSSGSYRIDASYDGDASYNSILSSGTITALRRPLSIISFDASSLAQDIFVATAAVRDSVTLQPLSAKSIRFVFENSTYTALSGADGVAVSTFSAPSVFGNYQINQQFDGDITYLPISSSSIVNVLKRQLAITADNPAAFTMAVFSATATIKDANNNTAVSGKSINFIFQNSTFTAITNAGGVAVSTFTAPSTADTYRLDISCDSDSLYQALNSTVAVIVIKRPVAMSMNNIVSAMADNITVSATLTDAMTAAALPGKNVSLTFNGTTLLSVTDSSGEAENTFSSPVSSGVYALTAQYDGSNDLTYSSGSVTASATIVRRPSVLAADNCAVDALDVFVATATLIDVNTSLPVANKTISFVFEGATITALTNASGMAMAGFTAPISSGAYQIALNFSGDAVYIESSGNSQVTVLPRATLIKVYDAIGTTGDPLTLNATLLDSRTNLPIQQKNVTFAFDGTFKTVTTNSVGIASATFTAPSIPGNYPYAASFQGDYTYKPSSGTANVRVGLLTAIIAYDAQAFTMDSFIVKAKLTDIYSIGLQNKTISFIFEGSTVTAVTDSQGVATQTFTAPFSSGTYSYSAGFAGDNIYSMSSASATLVVVLRPSSLLTYTNNTIVNSSFTAKVDLKDVTSGWGIPDKSVNFVFYGNAKTALTNINGEATAEFYAAVSTGTHSYSVNYAGDTTYVGTNSSGTVIVGLRQTTLISNSVANAVVDSTFSANVELKDNYTNTGIAGKTVNFVFLGSTKTAVTDGFGMAYQTFTAPVVSGSFSYSTIFEGDTVYEAATSSALVTSGCSPTLIVLQDLNVRAEDPFIMEAKLLAVSSMQGIPGRNITFSFQGSTKTAVTNALGISSVTYMAPASTGSYICSAGYEGDITSYLESTATAHVVVAKQSALLVADGDISSIIREPVQARAVLLDPEGNPLAEKVVNFSFEGLSASGITNSIGVATASFTTNTVPASSGTYNYTANYPGDTTYVGCADNNNSVYLAPRATTLVTDSVKTLPQKVFTASVTLIDNVVGSGYFGVPVASKTVTVEFFDGVSTTSVIGVSNSYGVVNSTFISPATVGTYNYSATFGGDSVYDMCQASNKVYVLVDNGSGLISTQLFASPVSTYVTDVFKATATLASSGVGISDKVISFSYYDGISTVTVLGNTDAYGMVFTTFTAAAIAGDYNYMASFAGDGEYALSVATGFITVEKHPLSIAGNNVSVSLSKVFTATATVTDSTTSIALQNKNVTFTYYNGISTTTTIATTDNNGIATANFTSPDVAGIYNYYMDVDQDSYYASGNAIAQVIVSASGQDTFIVSDDLIVDMGEVFTASATLTSRGRLLPGYSLQFNFAGDTSLAITSDEGIASTTFIAPTSTDTYTLTVSFAGSGNYAPTTASAKISVVEAIPIEDPADIRSSIVSPTQVNLTWTSVFVPKNNIKGYLIERSGGIKQKWETVAFVYSTSALVFTDIINESKPFYRVRTELYDGQKSKGLSIIERQNPSETASNDSVNRFFLSEDGNGWATIPETLMKEMYLATTSTSPLKVRLIREDCCTLLLAYKLDVPNDAYINGDTFEFNGSRRGVKVSISYESIAAAAPMLAQSQNKQMAMFWNNGMEWLKVGGYNNILLKECSVYSKRLGKFGIAMAATSNEFNLTKVVPRIFSPDESSIIIKKVCFVFENPKNEEVAVRIYDLSGAIIRRNVERESDNIMSWDGRDMNSNIVDGGIYIYQIEVGEKIYNGSIVVAK